MLKPQDVHQQKLAALNRLFYKNTLVVDDVDLYSSIKDLMALDRFDQHKLGGYAEQLNKIITKLNLMAPMVHELETSLQDQDSIDSQHFFSAAATKLDDEQIQNVLHYSSENIKSLIGNIYHNVPVAPRLLLWGPQGNGKTTLPQAIAQICKRPLLMMRIAAIGNKYQFSQQKHLKTISNFLVRHANGMILLDEIDCIFTSKKEDNQAAQNLCDLIKDAKVKYPLAVFAGTTNCDVQHKVDNTITRDESGQKEFPPQLKALFGQNVYKIENPGFEQRREIISYFCKRFGKQNVIKLSDADIAAVAKSTNGFAIRELNLCLHKPNNRLWPLLALKLAVMELKKLLQK